LQKCSIANVNIGTSGAEIGGAFGEKKQVVDVSQVQMHGKYICVVKPIHQLRNLLPLAQGINLTLIRKTLTKKFEIFKLPFFYYKSDCLTYKLNEA
jgi:hypothetical protein